MTRPRLYDFIHKDRCKKVEDENELIRPTHEEATLSMGDCEDCIV